MSADLDAELAALVSEGVPYLPVPHVLALVGQMRDAVRAGPTGKRDFRAFVEGLLDGVLAELQALAIETPDDGTGPSSDPRETTP